MSNAESLLDSIRRRPAMYFGSKSLRAFYHFVCGYQIACSQHAIDAEVDGLDIPRDFNDWVAYRTHHRESTSGWCNMILSTTQSEEQAFDRFYELLDEHSKRKPRLIAEILNPTSNTRRVRNGVAVQIPPPERVRMVRYTDDPGFFALHGSEDWRDRFYPYLSWQSGLVGGQLVIHDEPAYDELRRRNLDWEKEVVQLGQTEDASHDT